MDYVFTELPSCKASTPGESARLSPLHLANALSACVMSARLTSHHRQWSAQQLVHTLAAQSGPASYNMVDLSQDLVQCVTSKLEAHQNRVTGCTFHGKKCLLATRYVNSYIPTIQYLHYSGQIVQHLTYYNFLP